MSCVDGHTTTNRPHDDSDKGKPPFDMLLDTAENANGLFTCLECAPDCKLATHTGGPFQSGTPHT